MHLIGDVHAKFTEYHKLCRQFPETIQLGDMGIGFREFTPPGEKHRFIRGNHDNPHICRLTPGYLGDFGYLEEHEIFFLGGAWSIDQAYRIEGRDWWPEEELDYRQFSDAMEMYKRAKPKTVISHGAPFVVYDSLMDNPMTPIKIRKHKCRTASALDAMFEEHQPERWIFAHFHMSRQFELRGTFFKALRELEVHEL